MTLPPDAAAILAAIRETPADDMPRLAFADYLEETDVPAMVAWAEFVRVQCELVKPITIPFGDEPSEWLEMTSGEPMSRTILRRRERELWPAVRPMFGYDPIVSFWCGSASTDAEILPLAVVTRGMPSHVRCTLAQWRGGRITQSVYGYRPEYDPGIGPRVVATWPVELVEITDRAPQRYRYTSEQVDVFGWCKTRNGDPFNLPAEVFDALPRGVEGHGSQWRDYPSIEMARDAMSKVLLLEARSPAEVPT